MPQKVLVIEDDPDLRRLVSHYLERENYLVRQVGDGAEGLRFTRQWRPDLVILDLFLPSVDGLEVCRALRRDAATAAVPIVMLTAKADESDRVVGLELGADDYVTKPFSPKELVARVRAVLRRSAGPVAPPRVFHYGPIEMDSVGHRVTVDGREVRLTAKEFALLAEFLTQAGRVLSREVLLNRVWGLDYFGTTRTVDVHVRRLREKIPALATALITVKSYGYRLNERPEDGR